MEVEPPIGCGDAPAFSFHAALPRMEGATLGGHPVRQVRHTSAQRCVTPPWRVAVGPHAQRPVDGVVGLIPQRPAGGPLGGGAQRHTAATGRGAQGSAGPVRPHRAIAPDAGRHNGAHRLAGGARDAPEGETTQTDPSVMGGAGQTPATGAGRFMGELQAQGEEQGEDACDTGLAIVHQLHGGG